MLAALPLLLALGGASPLGSVVTKPPVYGNGTASNPIRVTGLSTGGNATTATSLAANGSNCSAGQAARGVDASGAAEDCFTPALSETDPTIPDASSCNSKMVVSNGSTWACDPPSWWEEDPNVNALGKASLSCSEGQVAAYVSAAWTCSDTVLALSALTESALGGVKGLGTGNGTACASGYLVSGFTSAGAMQCAADQTGGGSYTLPAAQANTLGGVKGTGSSLTCSGTDKATGFDAAGALQCSADQGLTSESDPGVASIFKTASPCGTADQIAVSNGSAWSCQAAAPKATALAANGSNCSSGQAARGVDASGAAEDCWTPTTTYTLPPATGTTLGGLKGNGVDTSCTAGSWVDGWNASTGAMSCSAPAPVNDLATATLSCPDGGAPVWREGTRTWACGWMPGLTGSCSVGQHPSWNGGAWVCASIGLRATLTYNMPALGSTACDTPQTVLVQGSAVGGECIVGFPSGWATENVRLTCWVSGDGYVKLQGCCTSACNPPSTTYSVRVFNP